MTFGNEGAFQTTLVEAYQLSNFTKKDYEIKQEYETNFKKADIVFRPYNNGLPAIIFELKYNKSTNEAMKQIEDKGYVQGLKDKYKKILYVGINYNSETDNVDDRFSVIIEDYKG